MELGLPGRQLTFVYLLSTVIKYATKKTKDFMVMFCVNAIGGITLLFDALTINCLERCPAPFLCKSLVSIVALAMRKTNETLWFKCGNYVGLPGWHIYILFHLVCLCEMFQFMWGNKESSTYKLHRYSSGI